MMACSFAGVPGGAAPDISTIVAGTLQAMATPAVATASVAPGNPTSAAAPTQPAGVQVAFGNVRFTIPTGLATGASCETVPEVNAQNGGPWETAPAFTRCTLQGYPLVGTFFEPQVMVYPAPAYASVNAGASLSLQRLQAILANPSGSLSNDVLPRLPYANAEQIIGALPKVIGFNGGSGVRVLAEYSQGFVQIDNHDLFYHFEGLTNDGKTYIVAVLPANAAFLAADGDPNSSVPPDGIPFPPISGDGTQINSYLQTVTEKLNATAPDAFRPVLGSLDMLIQSLQVTQ